MLFAIDEKDPRPIYQQIVDEVRRAVVLGTLAPEAALPSVRQLAAELRVNPNTVQQAYRELERAGVVYVRRGQGTYVAELRDGGRSRERKTLAAALAQRALREAYRHGLDAEELIEAIERAAADAAARGAKRGGA
ncbi:MAG: GntR family transcriptional regulator [Gemmatimonadetes bacterium]|nr:GntR family transcriptional regulator [Gemmatimonadota bacterium]